MGTKAMSMPILLEFDISDGSNARHYFAALEVLDKRNFDAGHEKLRREAHAARTTEATSAVIATTSHTTSLKFSKLAS